MLTCGSTANAGGSGLGFVTSMGGSLGSSGLAIALDGSNNIYIGGNFDGMVDFDPGLGVANRTGKGHGDIFICKLDSSGNFLWVGTMGDINFDTVSSIAVDASGNVYMTGTFDGTVDFNPGGGTFNIMSEGNGDIFVSKLSSTGNFLWATSFGTPNFDFGTGIALDALGNVYTTGLFQGTADFDPGGGVFNLTIAGSGDVFISKLDSSGNFVWAKSIGGVDLELATGIALDASGNVHTTGTFQGTVDFDPGKGIANLNTAGLPDIYLDIFVSKLDSSGNFIWARAMGGTSANGSLAVAVDSSGNVYTMGHFAGTADFDPGKGLAILVSTGADDIYLSKLDSSGNFVWVRALGGTSDKFPSGILADSSGSLYTVGSFQGTVDFDPGPGSAVFTSAGSEDLFVHKLTASGDFAWVKIVGGTGIDRASGIALDSSGNDYITGGFGGMVDFDPGVGVANLTSLGPSDIFVSNLITRTVAATAWVDFAFVGGENGSKDNPFDSLGEALAAVVDAGVVKVKGDTADAVSNETLTIDQGVTIEAVNGPVRIGDLGGRSSDQGGHAGFVSRH